MRRLARFISVISVVAAGMGVAVGVGIVATASPAGAQLSITVNDASDSAGGSTGGCLDTPTEGDCTLRDALYTVESQDPGADATITLPDPNTVANNANSFYSVHSTNGELLVEETGFTVTIDGAGQSTTVIEAICDPETDCIRPLKIETGTTADISGINVQDGNPSGDVAGGILVCGTLNLSDSTVTNNTAADEGGGIGITSGGSSTLDDVTVSNNTQTDSDGGDGGGGIYFEGQEGENASLTIEDGSTITGNSAISGGGGIELAGDDNATGSVVTIENSSITNNTTPDGDDVSGGGLSQFSSSTLTVTDTTITGNSTTTTGDFPANFGGGVSLEAAGSIDSFTGDTISGNTSDVGGGVSFNDAGDPTFANDTISGNTAAYGASGLYIDSDAETTTVTGSTFSGNNSTGDGGATVVSDFCNNVSLTNDTIADNTAATIEDGEDPFDTAGFLSANCGDEAEAKTPGGTAPWAGAPGAQASGSTSNAPHVTDADQLAFTFDTFDGNVSGGPGGGNISQSDDSNINLSESIVAGGTANGSPANCALNDGATVVSGGYNLTDGDGPPCGLLASTDITNQDPQLASLANNGGPTETLLPPINSPEVGAIPAPTCTATGVNEDQRGIARGAGPNDSCTIGSVEVGVNFNGYRLVANEGGIFDFGLNFNGSLANNHLNAPIVGLANSPGPNGYVMVGADGGVFALGGANFYGSLGASPIPSPIAAIAAPPTETGYWLAAQNGKIYNFGSVPPLAAVSLPGGAHIVGMASTTDGQGAWLTDQYGDVYAEGDASYEGGVGTLKLNAPVVGIAAAASGQGYLLVGSDGGVYRFGTQGFYGSVPGSLKPGQSLVAPIVGIAVTHSGNGYWEVGADGGVFNYGDAPFLGSIYTAIPGRKLNGPIVGIQHLGAAAPAG